MFSNNRPFGTATTFGGSTFGTSSTTPFGQNTSAFGVRPPGTNVFGTTTPSSGGLFGTATPSAGTNLFGQTSTAFGQPSSTTSNTFGFGTTAATGGLFGNTSQQTTSGLFGASGSSTSPFGPRPTFGGFGSSTSGGTLFGQPQPQQATAGLFGSSGAFGATATSGTTIKFTPPTGTDTMMKGGASTNINTRHQCITCMKEYENKSLEELRMEDYVANRKGPQAGSIVPFGSAGQNSLFGTPATTSTFSFGSNQNKTLFGGTNTFGSTGTTLFGQTNQQNTGLFGKSVGFGTPTTSAPSSFGFSSSTGGGLFGQNTQPKTLFGQPPTTGLFGSTTTTQPSTAFGASTSFGSAFGTTPQQSGSLFGAKSTAFGQTSTTTTNTFTFGTATNTGTGLFGQKTGTMFGTGATLGAPAPAFGSFGVTSNTSSNLFGQPKVSTGFGSSTGGTIGSGLGTGFGATNFNLGLGSNTGSSVFGSTASKTPGFNFGAPSGFAFGPSSSLGSFNFGPSTTVGLGSDPNAAAAVLLQQQQQNQVQQQILALTTSPFGDSPLFRNIIKDTKKREDLLKPTNPAAQKALMATNQYKMSIFPSARVKPKSIQPLPNGKISLFDGLEDAEPSLGSETFVPRRSVKKLVIKQNPPTGLSSSDKTCDNSAAESINSGSKNVPTASTSLLSEPLTLPTKKHTRFDISPKSLEKNDQETSVNSDTGSYYANPVAKPIPEHPNKVPSSQLDNTIEELQIPSKNKPTYGYIPNVSSDTESRDSIYNSTINEESTLEIDLSQERQDTTPHSCGIVLRRLGYYVIPSLVELDNMVDENGNCFVENFSVGRDGFGSVFFPGKINVAGLNLDEIVHFRRKEITIYPDDDNKPPVGEGLNRKAQVTLDHVWPTDKTTHASITDPERLRLMHYQEKIERATIRLGAKFIDYRPETGSWVFQVQHFSKYGLEDSDEEHEVTNKLYKSQPAKKKEDDPSQNIDRAFHAYLPNKEIQEIRTSKSVISRDEDDEMEDIMTETSIKEINMPETNFPSSTSYSDVQNSYFPSHRLASILDVDAERVQGMKASFFQSEQMEDDSCYHTTDSDLGISQKNMKKIATENVVSRFPRSEESLNPLIQKVGSHRKKESKISPREKLMDKHYPLISTPTTQRSVTPLFSCSSKVPIKSYSKSLTYNKHHLIADIGCFMAHSFRPGWSTNWNIAHIGTPLEMVQPQKANKRKTVMALLSPPSSVPVKKSSPFMVSLEKIKVSCFAEADKIVEANLKACLEVQLSHSVSTIEDGSPIFVPVPGIGSLHAHADLTKKQLASIDSEHPDFYFVKQAHHVWELCIALWGNISGYDKDIEGIESYACQIARKEALSKWLIDTTEEKITREINNDRFQSNSYLGNIFSYLTGQQIQEASNLSQDHKDYRLSLVLAQAGTTSVVKRLMSKQLEIWEQSKADKFIDSRRLKIYALLAGTLVWQPSDKVVNCCENLDWKRALALHLWYHCEPTDDISIAIQKYEKAFQGSNSSGRYAHPPYPHYIEDNPSLYVDAICDEQFETYDICFHLLKMYCDRLHKLEKLLVPTTHVPSHLDHRLSWLVYLMFVALGHSRLSPYSSHAIHCNFASQLETMGLWHWAVFVLLHIPDPLRREATVKDLLLRHVTVSQDMSVQDKEVFLTEKLKLPNEWIFQAKAAKAYSLGRLPDQAWYLLKAKCWSKSHEIVLNDMMADAIINENYGYIRSFLDELSPTNRSSTILDWNTGGQVFLDYIIVSQAIDKVIKGDISAYELEKLQPEVISVCNRISSLSCPTAKDRLCQAEMAKKIATLLRSVLVLQSARQGRAHESTYHLACHITSLPLPEDYALQELQAMTRSYMLAVAHE